MNLSFIHKSASVLAMVALVALSFGAPPAYATNNEHHDPEPDTCNEEYTYTFSSQPHGNYGDDSSKPANIDYINTNSSGTPDTVTVSADSGFAITKVQLSIDDDNIPGFATVANGPVSNFNPSPGTTINVAKVTVKKICPNVVPVANPQDLATPYQTPLPITLTGSDSDSGPNPLTFQVVGSPTIGQITGTPPNITYTPNNGQYGDDSFEFRVYDGADYSVPATITIEVGEPVAPNPECSDGQDNDGDQKVDMQDPGCLNEDDNSETDPSYEDQCVIVSDTLTQEGDDAAVEVSFIHGAWNSVTTALSDATWIWGEDPVSPSDTDKTEVFTRTFSLTSVPASAMLEMSADNGYLVKVNGTTVDDRLAVETNYSSVHTYNVASLLVAGSNTLEVTVKNFAQEGGTPQSNPAGLIFRLTANDTECGQPPSDDATVVVSKVICDAEQYLPNWGNGGADITSSTAQDWVNQSEGHCSLAKDWSFQWAPGDAGNPGDNVTEAGEPWTTFSNSVTLPDPEGAKFWFREVIPSGYLPFSGSVEDPRDNVSAEFYCHTDVLNYDNFDWIEPTNAGETYYCVGFNVRTEQPQTCNPEINLIANGGFETPDVGAGSYDIVEDINLDVGSLLQWLVAWTSPQDGGRLGLEIQDHVAGDPALGSGDQFAELDGDHPVTISQTIPTVIGQEYTVSFKYSPRAGRNATDNQIEVRAGGSTLGTALAEDGTANGNTVWNTYTRTFTATNSNTLIEFADTGTDTSYGGYLDDVRVSCTPEEETPPACSDDRDNDKDEYTDYPNDPGCSSPEDNDESNETSETDMCPNIEGTQTQLPEGYVVLDNGDCAEHEDVGGSASRHGGGGEVLGATTESVQCSPLLTDYLKMGWANNPEQVTKLQEFLNQFMNSGLPVTGFFGPATHEAVKAFQMKYGMDVLKPWVGFPASGITGENTPTGYVYQTTRWQINNLWCPGSEAFPTPLI